MKEMVPHKSTLINAGKHAMKYERDGTTQEHSNQCRYIRYERDGVPNISASEAYSKWHFMNVITIIFIIST